MDMHDRFDTVVDAVVAGAVDDDERAQAEEHAKACAPCGAMLTDARGFSQWVRGAVKDDAPPADLEERIIARFREATAPKKRRRLTLPPRLVRWVSAVAAVIALAVLGGVFMERKEDRKSTRLNSSHLGI